MSLRQYLSSVVLTCFKNDDVLQSLFLFEGITSKDWCESIVIDGRWTSTFDVIVFSYVMKINVITVGNYMNGFSVQSSKTYFNTINPHLDGTSQQWIPDEPTIYLFFHMHLSPLVPAPSGNHFGFLEPLLTCQFKLEVNSIKEMTSLVSATKESLEVQKGGKQSTLDCWKKSKATNEDIAWGWIRNNKINIGKKDQKEMETARNTSERICSLEEVNDTSSSSPAVSVTPVRVSKGRHEHSWTARGCIIYFFLHQGLGRKCFKTTAKIFNLKVIFLVEPALLILMHSHVFFCFRRKLYKVGSTRRK